MEEWTRTAKFLILGNQMVNGMESYIIQGYIGDWKRKGTMKLLGIVQSSLWDSFLTNHQQGLSARFEHCVQVLGYHTRKQRWYQQYDAVTFPLPM